MVSMKQIKIEFRSSCEKLGLLFNMRDLALVTKPFRRPAYICMQEVGLRGFKKLQVTL